MFQKLKKYFFDILGKKEVNEPKISVESILKLKVDELEKLDDEKLSELIHQIKIDGYQNLYTIFNPTFTLQNVSVTENKKYIDYRLKSLDAIEQISVDLRKNIEIIESNTDIANELPRFSTINFEYFKLTETEFYQLSDEEKDIFISKTRLACIQATNNFLRDYLFLKKIETMSQLPLKTKKNLRFTTTDMINSLKSDSQKLQWFIRDWRKIINTNNIDK